MLSVFFRVKICCQHLSDELFNMKDTMCWYIVSTSVAKMLKKQTKQINIISWYGEIFAKIFFISNNIVVTLTHIFSKFRFYRFSGPDYLALQTAFYFSILRADHICRVFFMKISPIACSNFFFA